MRTFLLLVAILLLACFASGQDASSQTTQKPAASTPPPNGKFVLPEGTPVLLAFASPVDSRKAAIGDQVPLTLTEDLQLDGVALARKGAPAVATVTQVQKARSFGLPGVLALRVEYLNLSGNLIRLSGHASREGEAKPPNASILIPIAGPFTTLKRGTYVIIQPGTPFIAYLYADTPLAPAP